MRILSAALLALALPCVVAASAPMPPVISRISSGGAASPNTTFVISGAGLFPGTYAQLCPLSGTSPCLSLPPQPSSWEGGVKVTLPADAATGIGAWAVSVCSSATLVCSNSTQAQTFSLNAPRVSWVLGTGDVDGGVEAGGTLQIFGSALAVDPATGVCAPITAQSEPLPPGSMSPALFPPGGAATLALTRAPPTTPATTLVSLCTTPTSCTPLPTPTLASCHRIDVHIPPSTPTGVTYTLRVFNGLAGTHQGLGVLDQEMALAVYPPRTLPTSPTLTVGTDCAVAACFAAVKRAGGGVILIPAGVWEVPADTVLEVPSGTTVKGDVVGGSVLHWASNTLPPKGTPAANAAMDCSGPSTLSHLTLLLTSPAINALVFSSPSGCRGEALNITVDTLAGFPTWGIGPAFAAQPGSARWRLTNSYLHHRGNCSAQQSWPHNTAYTVWGSRDGLFANSTVVCFCQGHSTDSSHRIVFDGNAVFSVGSDSQGSGFSTFSNPQVLEHLYIGRQVDVGNPGAAKRWESMTLDGPGGATFATFASLSSDGSGGEEQTLTLVEPARAGPWGVANISTQFLGASVSVLYGPGLGGLARVSGFRPYGGLWNESLVMTLHPPLLTRPTPGLSYLAINPFRGGLVWEGNTYVNDTTWQLWAQATEVVLAGGYFQSFPGGGDVRSWPLFYQCPFPAPFSCAWQPNVGVDFLHNTLRCVGMNIVTSDYSGYSPVNLTLALGITRRGNRLVGGGNMGGSGRTDDVLVEGTVMEGGVCQVGGPTLPPGTINVNAPHTLVR